MFNICVNWALIVFNSLILLDANIFKRNVVSMVRMWRLMHVRLGNRLILMAQWP